ncbi:MAG: cytochrome-c oxidase, cbb3-type subunit III [Parvibaculaceae bacterium]
MSDTPHKDDVTGVDTTGHQWDDIRELNNPLPKWWVYTFYATIVWSVLYWIVMPAWPVFMNGAWTYTGGVIGYEQREVVESEIAEVTAGRQHYIDQIAEKDLATIKQDAELMEVALAGGSAAFGDNCAPCHGSGAQGSTGFPNLNDDEWIWGGELEEIHVTLQHGIRWEQDDETRFNMMPRFLADGILSAEEVSDVTDYVLSLSREVEDQEAVARGAEIFEAQCTSCHMEGGTGNQELGAPNLANAIWLYGGSREAVYESIAQSRAGQMPAWGGRLDPATVKQLALYVHSLGGGE